MYLLRPMDGEMVIIKNFKSLRIYDNTFSYLTPIDYFQQKYVFQLQNKKKNI